MRVPNAEHAFVDQRKLVDYCLDDQHPVGKHKARVFRSALDIGPAQAKMLENWLLEAVSRNDQAKLVRKNSFGRSYVLDFEAVHDSRSAVVRCTWIIRADEDFPRLVTCFIR